MANPDAHAKVARVHRAATAPVAPSRRQVDTRRLAELGRRATAAGLHRVHMVAWRDLDDPEAGGSELHAHRIASLWAGAGLDVTLFGSGVPTGPATVERNGYRAVRTSGRYTVFPRSALRGLAGRGPRPDGVVEIWNGMPFFSPLWARCSRVTFLHHVHAEMWAMTLPPVLARIGELVERRVAPPLYRRTPVVTLSESSRAEIVSMLGLPAAQVTVVPPGVDARFTPGPARSSTPMVLAVGRLVPVKRFPMLIEALARTREVVHDLTAVIVGEGYARAEIEAAVRRAGAQGWIELAGACSDEELAALYRRAWVLAGTSLREGWGMTVTEAGACGTPAVVTRIAGHVDAVEHGVSGLLVDDARGMAAALSAVLRDRVLRERLRRGAEQRAAALTWEATAAGTLRVLLSDHLRRAGAGVPTA